jgi:hypothetical protein
MNRRGGYQIDGTIECYFQDESLLREVAERATIIAPIVREGLVELHPDMVVDFEKTYTLEQRLEDGRVIRWTGVKPELGDDGRAVFRLSGGEMVRARGIEPL